MAARHSALRTAFRPGKVPSQVVQRQVKLPFAVQDRKTRGGDRRVPGRGPGARARSRPGAADPALGPAHRSRGASAGLDVSPPGPGRLVGGAGGRPDPRRGAGRRPLPQVPRIHRLAPQPGSRRGRALLAAGAGRAERSGAPGLRRAPPRTDGPRRADRAPRAAPPRRRSGPWRTSRGSLSRPWCREPGPSPSPGTRAGGTCSSASRSRAGRRRSPRRSPGSDGSRTRCRSASRSTRRLRSSPGCAGWKSAGQPPGRHAHQALSQIRDWSGLPAGVPLFHSRLTVESLPASLDGGPRRDRRDRMDRGLPRAARPVRAAREAELAVEAVYDRSRFEEAEIASLQDRLCALLESFAAESGRRLAEIVQAVPGRRGGPPARPDRPDGPPPRDPVSPRPSRRRPLRNGRRARRVRDRPGIARPAAARDLLSGMGAAARRGHEELHPVRPPDHRAVRSRRAPARPAGGRAPPRVAADELPLGGRRGVSRDRSAAHGAATRSST